jgi:hypothetical protein
VQFRQTEIGAGMQFLSKIKKEGAESEKRESKKRNSGIRFMDSIASREIAYQFQSPTTLNEQVERQLNVSIQCRMIAVGDSVA